MDVIIDYQRKDKDATKLPLLLLLSSFAAKMPMQTSVCQTVGVRARVYHFSRFVVSVRVGGKGMVVGGYALVHLPLQVNCVVSA